MTHPSDRVFKLKERYGQSAQGNFAVCDTIGVPHPYMIGAKHVVHAADNFGGSLGVAAIESAERHGVHCEWKHCTLSYKEHETALLVACKLPLKDGDAANPELHAYLLKIKPLCEEDKYAGMAFTEAK